MREKRREWSLAGDAGLLKHLQQFSENLMSRTNKTQEALDALTTQLSETAILIDNVTNTSLALANTQFIESRVQDDDLEVDKKVENPIQETADQDSATADLIATVTESIRRGLNIMDEKYRQMEVVDSDSEGDSDGAIVVTSVILGPNNPYQERPLPYVIDSDKWNNSTKIGLESSSSESDQGEEDEESDSEKGSEIEHRPFVIEKVSGLSSSSSEPDNYNQRNADYTNNGKLSEDSQKIIDSFWNSPTDNISKAPHLHDATPNFAEELAKRLGTVRQIEKPAYVVDKSTASINRVKDDLFAPDNGDDDAYTTKAKNVFTADKGLFDPSSTSLWKEKPIKTYKTNIIPASVDVPPPISTVSTKPKSAIDDLFADAESEDSDDIFSSKNVVRRIPKDTGSAGAKDAVPIENPQRKHLAVPVASNIATSTPETNLNTPNLFSDEEDVGELFSSSKGQADKSQDVATPSKKKLAGSVSILGNILASDIENKVSSRIPRAQSPDSSSNESLANYESGKQSQAIADYSRNTTTNESEDDRGSIVQRRQNTGDVTIESSNSSGISIRPPSVNNTGNSSIGVDFQPQMTSTRLKSEEIYRERVVSDSLFDARTHNPVNASSNSNQSRNQTSVLQDDVFEGEDLFGPPPLPKSDSKTVKSKVPSLFEDSDSGEELFSTTSSGSRSQKSTDFLASVPQYLDKSRDPHRKGLFDEDIDIFSSKDSPDVDIFGIASKSTTVKAESSVSSQKPPEIGSSSLFKTANRDSIMSKDSTTSTAQTVKPVTPKIVDRLFDDYDDDGDLFSSKPVKTDFKIDARNIFKDDDDSDLFSANQSNVQKQANDGNQRSTKHDPRSIESGTNIENMPKQEQKTSNILSDKKLFSGASDSHGLIFGDDDYDDLFAEKVSSTKRTSNVVDKTIVNNTESKHTEQLQNAEIEAPREPLTLSSDSSVTTQVKKPSIPPKKISHSAENVKPGEAQSTVNEGTVINEQNQNESKKSPPRTLELQGEAASSSSEENEKGQRRAVSGKIKNLIGKVGDLKILSPMDTPPLWRRSEEKTDEEDSTMDRDSDDGGCMSIPGRSTPSSMSESSATRKQSLPSTASGGSNLESAISFDEPAQIETLHTAASKTRVRIQAKRRPQSRHARKSALRHSGIDFDIVDFAENNTEKDERDSNYGIDKDTLNSATVNTNSDRLAVSTSDANQKVSDSSMSLAIDDKSDLGSLSKESSVSANKNTLLSPSTDEEDLFDVPPDLPEDPQKEDTLFGRAPILSPVDRILSERATSNFQPLRDTHISSIEDDKLNVGSSIEYQYSSNKRHAVSAIESESSSKGVSQPIAEKRKLSSENKVDSEEVDTDQEPIDPLHDTSHDPLKDPSQLFAFVTKTPSPEKGKNLLFSEDDSLFTSGSKLRDERPKKPVLDLFADDAEGDLFSATLIKSAKKPLKDAKISLFDDDNQDEEDESLFGSITKKLSPKPESQKATTTQSVRKKTSLFDDDDNDTNLFSDQSSQSQRSGSIGVPEQVPKTDTLSSVIDPMKTSKIKDIFGDHSSGEDDIFASKPTSKKVTPSKSVFSSDDDDDPSNIFGASSTTVESKTKSVEHRSSVKKSVTRDLKKTAEKIVEDPLSLLQDN